MRRGIQIAKSFCQLLAWAGLASSIAAGCAGAEDAPSSSLQEAEQDVSSSGVNATLSFQKDWGNGCCPVGRMVGAAEFPENADMTDVEIVCTRGKVVHLPR